MRTFGILGTWFVFGSLSIVGCAASVDPVGDPAAQGSPRGDPSSGLDAGHGDDAAGAHDTGSSLDTTSPSSDAPTPTDTASASTGGTGFTSPRQMFDHVNSARMGYATHIPYDGYPWMGSNASSMTWNRTLTWDDGLATEAQTEAQRLAAGGAPVGSGFAYQPPKPGESMWLTGIDGPKYVLSALSDAATKGTPGGPFTSADPGKWHLIDNGTFRMAVAYQTGSSSHNHRTRLGVGMADAGGDRVWWVLVFGD